MVAGHTVTSYKTHVRTAYVMVSAVTTVGHLRMIEVTIDEYFGDKSLEHPIKYFCDDVDACFDSIVAAHDKIN
jgi:hypothetical protein